MLVGEGRWRERERERGVVVVDVKVVVLRGQGGYRSRVECGVCCYMKRSVSSNQYTLPMSHCVVFGVHRSSYNVHFELFNSYSMQYDLCHAVCYL